MSSFKTIRAARCLLVPLIAVVLLLWGSVTVFGADDPGYDTKDYKVNVNVHEDNSAYITETVDVDITSPITGIERTIPLSQTVKFYDKSGQEVNKARKNIVVEDVSVEKDPFVLAKKNGNMVIRIGEEDKTLTGEHTYNYSYRVKLYDDGVKDYDVFYYNVLPDNWPTDIEQAEIKITMPKAFKEKSVNVVAGKGSSEYGVTYFDYIVEGNTITVTTQKPFPKGSYLTVGIMLEEGYWVNELSDRRTYLIFFGVAAVGALAMIYLYIKRGRDPKAVKTVEFYPPEDLTSAEFGLIVDGRVDRKDILSLIAYFANKGYLSIEEAGKNDYVLHREADLPTSAKSFERILFQALFRKGADVSLSDIAGKEFFNAYNAAAERVEAEYETKDKRLFSPKASSGRIMVMLIAIAGMGYAGWTVSKLFGSLFIFAATGTAMICMIISYVTAMQAEDRRYIMKKGGKLGITLISLGLLIASGAITYLYISLAVGSRIGGILYCVFLAAGYFSFRYMQCRTRYGAELLAKVLGFKEFIRVAEREKLEMLVKEDPSYFYDVLPYAYAMGLPKKWAQKFESITQEPPDWYRGGETELFNSVIFYRSFNNFMSAVATHINPQSGNGR